MKGMERIKDLTHFALLVVITLARVPYLLIFGGRRVTEHERYLEALCMEGRPGPAHAMYAGQSFDVPPVEGLVIRVREIELSG